MHVEFDAGSLHRVFFSLIQDRVPAFPVAKVRRLIQEQLGALPEALFAAFDDRPLAAASLGQVCVDC